MAAVAKAQLVIPWEMFTNYVDMQKGGEVLKVLIINNLAQCAGHYGFGVQFCFYEFGFWASSSSVFLDYG